MIYQKLKIVLVVCLLVLFQFEDVHSQKFLFEDTKKLFSNQPIPLAVKNNPVNERILSNAESDVNVKYSSTSWIHFSASPEWIEEQIEQGQIEDFYFEYAPPELLDDTARVFHQVDDVHDGLSPLHRAYTGKDVVVGIVDSGFDHDHPDFIDPVTGRKRLIRYWDQRITDPTKSPQPYNYGQIWYRQDILDGTITSNETGSAHGTTVGGIATGNGTANGRNKGFAPEADIIAVRSNFALPNWTLTVADACDYIFRVADSLGKPAVVNLSIGTIFGSHDAQDPAGIYIDELLEKPGRLVVCAAGNSGNSGKFHVGHNISADTTFTWLEPNPNNRFGTNNVFFDLWTDTNLMDFSYSLGANLPSGSYQSRASTDYRETLPTDNLLITDSLILDTLRNEQGVRLATIQIFQQVVGPNYNMRVLFRNVDSTDYHYRFSTTGSGRYDFWSGAANRLNKIIEDVPSYSEYPKIINYVYPDSLQTIVSSWNCSEKVVSVGNIRNRLGHIDKNGNQYYPSDMTPPGKIAPSSSRGPTRRGVIKPDISAYGEISLGSGPFEFLNNSANNGAIDEGGYHVRNGGTSMASPIVAGTAALYFEKCFFNNWKDFKDDLIKTAVEDEFTGVLPNFTYGHGKLHSYDVVQAADRKLDFLGDTVICQGPIQLSTSPPLNEYIWSTGENTSSIEIEEDTTIYVKGRDNKGCYLHSDTMHIITGSIPPQPVAFLENGVLISTEGPNYQWFLNDNLIPQATEKTYTPEAEGYYSVAFTNEDGCRSFSNAVSFTLSLNELANDIGVQVYPNPFNKLLKISANQHQIESIQIVDLSGRAVYSERINGKNEVELSTQFLARGSYILKAKLSADKTFIYKIVKH